MTLWEVLLSVWVLMTLGASSLLSMTSGMLALRSDILEQAVVDGADEAAELLVEGQSIPDTLVCDGQRVTIGVTYRADATGTETLITANIGTHAQVLWLSWPQMSETR